MDSDLLSEMGLRPVSLGPALLRGYELRIGDRATLVPKAGAVAYGMLIELADAELASLYSAPGVDGYRPYNVETERLDDGTAQPAVYYNLPADKLGAEFNSEYAKTLSALLLRLGFPSNYASEVNQPDL